MNYKSILITSTMQHQTVNNCYSARKNIQFLVKNV